jgi:membrane-associated phospholipid phosphatase
MTSYEWLTIAYLAGITAAGWRRRSPRRLRAAGYAAVAIALVIVARFTAPSAVRAWLPHAYLVLGYWLPALLTPVPTSDGFQRRLAAADARLWSAARIALKRPSEPAEGRGSSRLGSSRYIKSGALGWFELAYLLCYPIVPISFSIVWVRGIEEDAVRFWLAVLTAGFACYGTLPWTAAWPPRLFSARGHRGLAATNLYVLQRLSHGLNTFPSGHVAVSVAASLAVASVWPAAGATVGLMAASIAAAAIVGRYHYVVDVILGLLIGILTWALTTPLISR